MAQFPSRLELTADDRLVTVRGEIDVHSVPELAQCLGDFDARDGDLELDLSGVEFIDSSGLRLVIESHARFAAVGHVFVLRAPSTQVRRLIDVSGLDGTLVVSG